MSEPNLSHLLLPPGTTREIGTERSGKIPENGIARFVSPHGSYRYVAYADGQAVGGLQIVRNMRTEKRWVGQVAQVYTHPDYRRLGVALSLMQRAFQDFDVIHPARDLSSAGSSFQSAWMARLPEASRR